MVREGARIHWMCEHATYTGGCQHIWEGVSIQQVLELVSIQQIWEVSPSQHISERWRTFSNHRETEDICIINRQYVNTEGQRVPSYRQTL